MTVSFFYSKSPSILTLHDTLTIFVTLAGMLTDVLELLANDRTPSTSKKITTSCAKFLRHAKNPPGSLGIVVPNDFIVAGSLGSSGVVHSLPVLVFPRLAFVAAFLKLLLRKTVALDLVRSIASLQRPEGHSEW